MSYYSDLKREVLKYYSDAPDDPRCNCCHESHIEFLTIDHVCNDGSEHRKVLKGNRSGDNFYRWLKNNDYPDGFQVLCYNCNLAKGHYGICPHQEE